MKTAITELFGIRHPIIQGGMHYVGLAELASALSNAADAGASGQGNRWWPVGQLISKLQKWSQNADR